MLNENCGRYRTLVKNIEADSNEVLAVTLGKIRYRTNKSSFRLTEFRSSFRRCILPHNDAVFSPARLLKSTEGIERARIMREFERRVSVPTGYVLPIQPANAPARAGWLSEIWPLRRGRLLEARSTARFLSAPERVGRKPQWPRLPKTGCTIRRGAAG